MLDLFYNVYNLKDYFNNNNFKMYLFGSNWVYYYWFIDIENTKSYILNVEYSKTFRIEVSLIIEPWKYLPYKNKDKIFVSFNWDKILSILNRTYNRDVIDLEVKKLDINSIEFFKVIKY